MAPMLMTFDSVGNTTSSTELWANDDSTSCVTSTGITTRSHLPKYLTSDAVAIKKSPDIRQYWFVSGIMSSPTVAIEKADPSRNEIIGGSENLVMEQPPNTKVSKRDRRQPGRNDSDPISANENAASPMTSTFSGISSDV
jgi:hypothetical protein